MYLDLKAYHKKNLVTYTPLQYITFVKNLNVIILDGNECESCPCQNNGTRQRYKTSSFGYKEVTSTNLVANITGARRASQGLNETLILNGTLSHDPDVGPGEYTGIEFTWLCRRNNERFPNKSSALCYVCPQSGLTPPPGQDKGGCYGTGVGKLKPWDGKAYIVDLNVDKMKGDEDYVIKLIMKKRGLTTSAVHLLRIKEDIHLTIV